MPRARSTPLPEIRERTIFGVPEVFPSILRVLPVALHGPQPS